LQASLFETTGVPAGSRRYHPGEHDLPTHMVRVMVFRRLWRL